MKKNPPVISFELRTIKAQKGEPRLGANLALPTRWEQLTQAQAHKLLRLLSLDIPRTRAEIKTAALCMLTGIRIIGKAQDDHYIIEIPKSIQHGESGLRPKKLAVDLTPEEFACILRELDWILQPLKLPWRPDKLGVGWLPASGLRPKHVLLQGLPFGQWLALENLWAGYLHTSQTGDKAAERKIMRQIIGILTERPKISDNLNPLNLLTRLTPIKNWQSAGTALAITNWISALKQYFTHLYPDFYQPINDSTSLAPDGKSASNRDANAVSIPSPAKLREVMNAQIRALTKGDITKEEQILALPLDRALTELNALAREYKELKAKTAK